MSADKAAKKAAKQFSKALDLEAYEIATKLVEPMPYTELRELTFPKYSAWKDDPFLRGDVEVDYVAPKCNQLALIRAARRNREYIEEITNKVDGWVWLTMNKVLWPLTTHDRSAEKTRLVELCKLLELYRQFTRTTTRRIDYIIERSAKGKKAPYVPDLFGLAGAVALPFPIFAEIAEHYSM